MAPESQITPELRLLAQELATLVQRATCEEHRASVQAFKEHLDLRLDELQGRIERRIAELRIEFHERMNKIDERQAEQAKVLNAHGAQLSGIKERLDCGDKEFDRLQKEVDDLKKGDTGNRVKLASLAASMGKNAALGTMGGAAAIAIMKLLGASSAHAPAVPAPEAPAPVITRPAENDGGGPPKVK